MTTVCLCMIVKDEAPVIERCLTSVKPFVDAWLVVDTGSTDGTQDLVRKVMAGLPGELVERPWRDFAANRTEALALARPRGDYAFVIDADDVLEGPPREKRPALTADGYLLEVVFQKLRYSRVHLLKSSAPWRYEGVVHEAALCEREPTVEILPGYLYRCVGGGARAKDADRYRKDAEALERALVSDPKNARNVFYLAQSHRDAGDHAKALEIYQRRAAMGGWDEEVYVSLLHVGRMREKLGQDKGAVWEAYLRAYQHRPSRAEALHDLARYCRLKEDYALAHAFATMALAIPMPADRLFVEEPIYKWRALDEFAVSAYYVGKDDEALEANDRLLREGHPPEKDRARIQENRAYSIRRKASAPVAVGDGRGNKAPAK